MLVRFIANPKNLKEIRWEYGHDVELVLNDGSDATRIILTFTEVAKLCNFVTTAKSSADYLITD